MLYQINDATVTLGGNTILSHIDFGIHGTEKIAVVGRNGAGKSTLLNLIAGNIVPDRDDFRKGEAVCQARKLSFRMLSQKSFSDYDRTLEEELNHLYEEHFGMEMDRERFAYECECQKILTGFGLSLEDKKKKLSAFSGGEQTKLAMISLLLEKPDVLLLDEPTNHLDVETVEWLENYLKEYKKAVVIVSHDRFFLDRVAEVVYEVEGGKLYRYAGNYSAYRMEKRKQNEIRQKKYESWLEEKNRLEELIKRFKNKPKKASMARSKKKVLERMMEPEKPVAETSSIFTGTIDPVIPGGKVVYEAKDLKVGYDKALFETSFQIRRGQKIGIIGANGVGKTALLKTISGLIPPVSGKGELGFQILMGYFDQKTAEISSEKTVFETFSDLYPSMTEKEVRTFLASYLFSGRDVMKKIDSLSGGEKVRLVLAEILKAGPNFCVLDEPTNHCDIPAKETLESAFQAYTGTLLFISHDRYFISKVAKSLFVIENEEVYYYPFGYEHYLEHKQREKEGIPIGAIRKAEDEALIAKLKAVPKREYFLLHPESDDKVYYDWQKRLMEERFEKKMGELEAEMAGCSEDILSKWEWFLKEWEKACISWYEEYMTLKEETEN